MSYEKINWENEGDPNETDLSAENLGHMDDGIYNLQNVELISVSSTAPSTCAVGDKYFNTTTNKIYTATAENTWGATGENAVRGIFYIVIEETTTYYYDGTTLVSVGGGSGSGSDLLGTIKAYTGATVPNGKGYLLCDGSAISRTEYSDLFALIGTNFGTGDGSTTFNLPNLKGKTIVGLDILDTDFNLIGKTGGEKAHTLLNNELPAMSLTTGHFAYSDSLWTGAGGITHAKYTGQGTSGTNDEAERANLNAGSQHKFSWGNNQPHNNLQPYIALNYIIKAYETTSTQAEVIDSMDEDSTTNAPSIHAVRDYVENYSTSEQVIGKWLGKPLYRKTISINVTHSASTTQMDHALAHGISNVETIFIDQGRSFFETGDNKKYIFGRAYIVDGSVIFNGACNVNTTNINIEVYANFEVVVTGYVTVVYTKTTD